MGGQFDRALRHDPLLISSIALTPFAFQGPGADDVRSLHVIGKIAASPVLPAGRRFRRPAWSSLMRTTKGGLSARPSASLLAWILQSAPSVAPHPHGKVPHDREPYASCRRPDPFGRRHPADELGLVTQPQGGGYLGRVEDRLDASVEATTAGHSRGTCHPRRRGSC